jgi:hypothetical protein
MRPWIRRAVLTAALLCALPGVAWAALQYLAASNGYAVDAYVMMWLNGSGAAVPVAAATPFPVTAGVSASITNPTSVLTRPADTSAYAQNDLIASSTTAGSVVVPSFAIANTAGGAAIHRLQLATNKTSGWDGVVLRVRLWTTAPTYTNGDNGAWAVATGAAGALGSFDITLAQYADGASGRGIPAVGTVIHVKLASGTSIFWDVQYTSAAALTPASGQTFTLTAEVVN